MDQKIIYFCHHWRAGNCSVVSRIYFPLNARIPIIEVSAASLASHFDVNFLCMLIQGLIDPLFLEVADYSGMSLFLCLFICWSLLKDSSEILICIEKIKIEVKS